MNDIEMKKIMIENEEIENELNKLEDFINNKEYKNSKELLETIQEITQIEEENNMIANISMSDLYVSPKYQKLIEGKESYPIWSVDDNGYCLVGESAKEIEHIDDILKCYKKGAD